VLKRLILSGICRVILKGKRKKTKSRVYAYFFVYVVTKNQRVKRMRMVKPLYIFSKQRDIDIKERGM
jgi:hypothetical protein